MRWVRAAVRSWVRPGSAGEIHSRSPAGVGHNLHVHSVTAVLLGEVGPAVADPVALGERSVEQDVVRISLAQDPQEAGRPAGQVLDDGRDVGVGGADGYAEAGGDLRERVVPAEVDQAHEGTRLKVTSGALACRRRPAVRASRPSFERSRRWHSRCSRGARCRCSAR